MCLDHFCNYYIKKLHITGVYRRAAEVAMKILRENKDSLMSVLESFVHDPLVEWTEKRRKVRSLFHTFILSYFHTWIYFNLLLDMTQHRGGGTVSDDLQRAEALRALEPIERKLKGVQITAQPLRLERAATPENQVESLVRLALFKVKIICC